MEEPLKVAVVGGGVSGLAAAHELVEQGVDVTVYEAAERVGGLAATYETRGDPIERYYHHLLESERAILAKARELGLGEDVEWRIGKTGFYTEGEVHPLDTPFDILRYPHLSVYDKFRLGMLTLGVDVRGGWPSLDAYEDVDAYDEVPLIDFLLEHTNERVYENFFEPLIDAKFGSRKEDVSAAWMIGRIQFRNSRDPLRGEILGYLEGGFHTLLDALVEAVGPSNIETGARVTGLDAGPEGVSAVEVDRGDGPVREPADATVVAAMPNVLEALTGYACEVDFQGTVCSVISVDEPITDTYWLNLADEAPFGVFIEHTNFVPPERYGGEHLVYLASYVQSPEDELWQLSDAGVEERWLDALEGMFETFDRSSVNWMRTSRNPRTAPVYETGYLDKLIPYDLAEAVAPGVYYAGMASRAQYPDRSLSGAIEAGTEAAQRLLEVAPELVVTPRVVADTEEPTPSTRSGASLVPGPEALEDDKAEA